MKIYIASQNQDKIREIASVLDNDVSLLSVLELGLKNELPETGKTLTANALQKARFIYEKFGVDCFADDTGLEVEALDGAPGVYSARYAGEQKNSKDNMRLLLKNLIGVANRKACFKTVIALLICGKEYIFEGEVNGTIAHDPVGEKGFGYDPVFLPEGNTKTFAEMTLQEKNKISHRARAVEKLSQFLNVNKNLFS